MTDQPNEKTLRQERILPGIFGLPVLVLLLLLVPTLPLAFFLNVTGNMLRQLTPQQNGPSLSLLWVPLVLLDALPALAFFVASWLAYLNSEITLTDRRLRYRTGMFSRASGEIPLENVEAIFLLEPLLGRLLGYGTVTVSTVGGLRFPLHYLGKPHLFHAALQNAVNAAKTPARAVAKPPLAVQGDSRYMPKG